MHPSDEPTTPSERDLNKALRDTFPASDPVSATVHLTATPTESSVSAAERSCEHPGTVEIYRVVDESQKDKPFGRGGNADARWTSTATSVVYAALSPATALLEFLVHCDEVPPAKAFLARATIPRERLTVLSAYPSTWQERPYRHEVQQVGDAWAASHALLAAQVPSALCEAMSNVILNPDHVDAPLIQGVQVQPIRVDVRLRRTVGG